MPYVIPLISPEMMQAAQTELKSRQGAMPNESLNILEKTRKCAFGEQDFSPGVFPDAVPIPSHLGLGRSLGNGIEYLSHTLIGGRPDAPIGIWDASKNFKLVLSYTPQGGEVRDNPDAGAISCYTSARTIDGFCKDVWNRYPVDSASKAVRTVVHNPDLLNNAFWYRPTEAIYFGGVTPGIFKPFDQNREIFWHETGHAIDGFTVKGPGGTPVGFTYRGESGALSEHWADVVATTVSQKALGVDVGHASWLVGAGVIDGLPTDARNGLRSMDDKPAFVGHRVLGDDKQPKTWDKLLPTTDSADNGNVHTNSGPLNHAFKQVCDEIKGYSWDKPGNIWYHTLQNSLSEDGFDVFVQRTINTARALYSQQIADKVRKAWYDVGYRFDGKKVESPATIKSNAIDWKTYIAVAGVVTAVGTAAVFYQNK